MSRGLPCFVTALQTGHDESSTSTTAQSEDSCVADCASADMQHNVGPVPQVRVVKKTVEDPQFQIVEKTVENPETLQQNKILRVIKKNLVKKCLEMLAEITEKNDPFADVKAMTRPPVLPEERQPAPVSKASQQQHQQQQHQQHQQQ